MKHKLESVYHLLELGDLIELCGELFDIINKKEQELDQKDLRITKLKTKLSNVKISNNQLIEKLKGYKDQPNYNKIVSNLQKTVNKQNEKLKRFDVNTQCTGKVRYDTAFDADASLATLARTSKRNKKPIRKYKCSFCGGFHLTSKTRRK